MPFKPNYRMQRADRQRAKEIKQQKKVQRRADKAAKDGVAPMEAPEGGSAERDEPGPGA